MDLVIASAIAAFVIVVGFAAVWLFSARRIETGVQQVEAAVRARNAMPEAQAQLSGRQMSDEFNLADYSDDRSVLVNDLMVESQRVTRKLEHVSNALREDVSTISALNEKILRLQGEIHMRDDQVRAAELRFNEARNETLRTQEEKALLAERNEQLEVELARKTNMLDSTKEMLLAMENSHREVMAQNTDLKNEVAHLNEDLQVAQARAADLTLTLEHRDMEMQRVNIELSNITSERNRANLAEAKVSRLMTQLEELKAEAKNDVDRFRAERDILKLKFDQAQDSLEAQRQRLAEAERNRERSVSQLEILRNELASYRAEATARTQSLESSNRELSSHVGVLERILEQYRVRPGAAPGPAAATAPQAPSSAPEAAKLRVVAREGEAG